MFSVWHVIAASVIFFLVVAFVFFIIGYKCGRRDEGVEWAEKEEYYQWLLEMKKRQDFEEVKVIRKKRRNVKKDLTCDICGKSIKRGTLCYNCSKEVNDE